ncbi:SdiA-regulated domain-containing protein [Escherichia coli]|nr:YjiK family protein [Escherichia coli]ELI9384161.1 YjiK family protein [Escherichia coli]ELK5904791.1 YjiK family protein [Escherichia coli]ELT7414894.1 YjiK family protein [Escherichia coli]MCN2149490.1 SdiA-regulated domain-containing protein [Escherichia coli]
MFYPRNIVYIALFVVVVSSAVFMLNFRHYEENNTEYQLDYIRQLSGIQNLSSLTFHKEQGYLYATQNKPATLLKLSSEGDILDSILLQFITDAETIEHISGNIFAAIDESSSKLFFFTVDNDLTVTLRNSIPLPQFKKKNHGYEGLAWDMDAHILYAAKERRPYEIYTWYLSTDLSSVKQIQLTDFPYQVNVDDISALDYSNGRLLLLSDESRLLLETDSDGKTWTEVLNLTQGNHGLNRDIPQPEGVARTPDGSIYIASEPNLIARFRPVSAVP